MAVAVGTTVLRIPNAEVNSIFEETIATWFIGRVRTRNCKDFFEKWWSGDAKALTQEVSNIQFSTTSYFDYREDYYHAFATGLFSGADYEVFSNSELGTGWADILEITLQTDYYHRISIALWEGKLGQNCDNTINQIEQ